MVVIRLARAGSKGRPFYHVVVIDSRRARNSGNYIERLGYFNPVARGGEIRIHLDSDRINHWIGLGAQPSDRVHNLMAESGRIAAGKPTHTEKRATKRKDKKAKAKELAAVQAAAEKEAENAVEAAPAPEAPAEPAAE